MAGNSLLSSDGDADDGYTVHVTFESIEEADRLYALLEALAAGGG